MRIALVGPTHPYKGGGARHTTELAHRLAAAGHDVVLESWHAQYPRWLYPGQQTIDVPEAAPYPRTRRNLAWYRPDGWWRTGRELARTADLAVFTVFSPVQVPPYLGLLSGIGSAAPSVALCHNVLPHERRGADIALMRGLLRRVDAVLTHSPQQAHLARGLTRGADVRTLMAELPPHLPALDGAAVPATDAVFRHLLFLGVVRPYKGVDVLLRALAAGPAGVSLTVAGEFWGKSTGPSLRALAGALGIADRVEFREGYVPARELPALFARADALVLPYRSATATQNVWLAHLYRRPVIATRAGTLADHVRCGVDGLLCAPGDAEDLARVLRRCYEADRGTVTVLRLRSGVRPVDPGPYWQRYIEALTASRPCR